jgi:hypothetical protein
MHPYLAGDGAAMPASAGAASARTARAALNSISTGEVVCFDRLKRMLWGSVSSKSDSGED